MTSARSWCASTETLTLPVNEVHVWRVALELEQAELYQLQQMLAPDELARAAEFRFSRDRRRFIAGRGALRTILGRYLGIAPRQLQFVYNPYGKPSLGAFRTSTPLRFNLARSNDLALIAATRGREIGVDLEQIRTDLAWEPIAERFFSTWEVAALGSLPTRLRHESFFNCWTRKEAYVKARGEGLSLRLDRFDVSLAPDDPAALLRTQDDPEESSRWSLQKLALQANYAAALAVQGHGWQLKCQIFFRVPRK